MSVESRKEQRVALAAAMRNDGCTWEDIAREFRNREPCSALLALRWAHNLSQQDVADAYNAMLTADPDDKPINFRRVHRWEQWPEGGTTPPLAALNRLAQIYQVRASFLFDGEDYRHLDSAYQPHPGGDPVRGELLATRHPTPATRGPGTSRAKRPGDRTPAILRPDQFAPFNAGPPGRLIDGLSPSTHVSLLHGRTPMERRAVLAAIASLPGVAMLTDRPGTGSLLDPEAHEIIDRAIRRPESVGAEILAPLDNLIMAYRHLDDTLGGGYVTGPVHSVIGMIGGLLTAATPAVRQPLFSVAASAAQFAGWLARDAGDTDEARKLYEQAVEWSMAADDAAFTAYLWTCRAVLCLTTKDIVGAVRAAEVSRRFASGKDMTLRSWVEIKAARIYATAGNPAEAQRALKESGALFATANADEAPEWLYHYHEEDLTALQGAAYIELGQGMRAAELLGDALDRLPPRFFRARGNYLAYQADAFRVEGDVKLACETGMQALQIARQAGSGFTMHRIADLHRSLNEQTVDVPEAQALGELLREEPSA